MALSAIVFLASTLVSVSNTAILSHDHCDSLPDIQFLNRSEVHTELNAAFSNAKESITIILTSYILDEELQLLKTIDQNKIKTEVILGNDDNLESKLRDNGFKNLVKPGSIKNTLDLNAIRVDNTIYLLPDYFIGNKTEGIPSTSMIQRIKIENCQPLYDDFISFLDFYKLQIEGSSRYKESYSQSLIAHSSAVRPTIVGESSVYAFHSSMSQMPFRISAHDVINRSLNTDIDAVPKRLWLYSTQFPSIPQEERIKNIGSPDVFLLLKALQFLNQTDMKYLIFKDAPRLVGADDYPSVEVRTLSSENNGPSFMVLDDEIFFFGHDISYIEGDLLSYNLRINDKTIQNKTIEFFNSIWAKSPHINKSD